MPKTARRGVYRLPFRDPQGRTILVAISSRNRAILELAVVAEEYEPGVHDLLRSVLDLHDPAPN